MSTRKELSFDGFGINGPDEFRSRIATMARTYQGTYTQTQIDYYGKLFESAPEMLRLLRIVEACFNSEEIDPLSAFVVIEQTRKILKEFPQ